MSLATKIKYVKSKHQQENNRVLKLVAPAPYKRFVAIGSSTGGTETLLQILREMPPDAPPILIVQHMPPVFTKLYAERLHHTCRMSVWEARDGDALQTGLALVAPGGRHMTLAKQNGRYLVECREGEKVFSQCPAVDVLFQSIADIGAAKDCVGVILTGMGADGARGLLAMRRAGAFTIGQDEQTCVVYGMPKAAFDLGAVMKQEPVEKIAAAILENI